MKPLLFLCAIFTCANLCAQPISGGLVSSYAEAENEKNSIQWVIGQIAVASSTTEKFSMSSGYIVASEMMVITSRDFETNDPQIRAYPNPFRETFTVEGRNIGEMSFFLRDAAGKAMTVTVVGYENDNITFLTGPLANGVYVLEILHANKRNTYIKLVRE